MQMHRISVGREGILGQDDGVGEWDDNGLRRGRLRQQTLSEGTELQQLNATRNDVHKQLKKLIGSVSVYSQLG